MDSHTFSYIYYVIPLPKKYIQFHESQQVIKINSYLKFSY